MPQVALRGAEVFEDEFPLIRSCPALNEIRLAEVKDRTELHANRIILAARIPSLRATPNATESRNYVLAVCLHGPSEDQARQFEGPGNACKHTRVASPGGLGSSIHGQRPHPRKPVSRLGLCEVAEN
nr:unnamed protein product [Spirometra erinaceieuropaei]